MKKPLRLLLIILGSLALLVALVVALAFTPGVQTWAARKFAPATPELTVVIGRVDAGLQRTRVENIRVIQPGLVLTLPSAEIDVGVLDAAGGKVAVKRLVAKGWTLDLTASQSATPATAPAPKPATPTASAPKPAASSKPAATPAERAATTFNGLFNLIQLPVDLSVDGVEIDGEVILPEGRALVTLTGGGLASGNTGKFHLKAAVATAEADVTVDGTLGARMDSPRTFDRFDAAVDVTANAQPIKGLTASVALNLAREKDAETYSLTTWVAKRQIYKLDVQLPPGDAPLSGTWTLDATTADAAPFALGQPLPDFVAKGQGVFSADRSLDSLKNAGSLDVTLDKLSALQPEFAALGRLTLAAGFDLALRGENLSLQKLDVRVAGAKPVLTVVALQPVTFNIATGAVAAATPTSELLRISLDGLPLAWAGPFLGDLALTGDDVRGAFTVTPREGGFAVRPVEPVTLSRFSATQAGAPLVSNLDITLAAQAVYSPSGLTADVTQLSVTSAGANLLKATARVMQAAGERQPLAVAGTYEADLPAVLAQPVAAGSAAVKTGVARGDFTASLADKRTASFTLQLANLVATDDTVLPEVALTARADVDAAGRINAQAPLVITQGKRRSDLTFGAVVTPSEKTTDIQAKLTSTSLHIPDLQLFSALTASPAPTPAPVPTVGGTPSKPAPKPAPAPSAPPPTAPVWAGYTGELTLALKSVVYSKDLAVNDVAGLVKITPAELTLQNLQAALKTGGMLKAAGGLAFDAKNTKPYGLNADVNLADVEPAPILRALSPGKPSPVEGKFDMVARLDGRSVSPSGFDDTVVGDVTLTGKGGTLKALNVKTSASVDNVGKAAAIAGILGQIAGSESTMKYADRARAAVDVTKQLGNLQFDQLNLVLARDEKNNMGIKDLSLLSPVVRLAGSGTVTYQPGVPLMQQPLLLTLQLAAKGKLGDDLRTLKLIDAKADAGGFASLVEKLTFDGSLQAVGTSQLNNLINRALTN